MNLRTPLIVTFAIVAAMLAASLWVAQQLPAGTPIAIHWNVNGEPDRLARGWYAVFMAPAMAALISLVFVAIPWLEPRRFNLTQSRKLYTAIWIGIVALMAVIHGATLYSALHGGARVGGVVLASVSLLIVVLGNYLGKSRSTFLVGVRTPWTLSSEYSWQRTHSLAGKLFMVAGLLGLVATVAVPSQLATRLFLYAMVATVVLSVAMSYVYWLRDPDRRAHDATSP
ncbi:MAG TPA: SdpI family protein [Rhizomicrobium sp.]|nr:SdpI family protein [Rhizomicrobium sp.]